MSDAFWSGVQVGVFVAAMLAWVVYFVVRSLGAVE